MPIIPTVYSRWFTPEWSWVPFLWSDMISKSGATAEIKSTKYPQRWFLVDQTWDKPWYSYYIFSAFRVRNLFRIFIYCSSLKNSPPHSPKVKKAKEHFSHGVSDLADRDGFSRDFEDFDGPSRADSAFLSASFMKKKGNLMRQSWWCTQCTTWISV